MTDSAADGTSTPDAPVERPDWRFSGRRGTPVHQREQAPATLPPEILRSIAQMAREREASADARTTRSEPSGLRLADSERAAPPVAGAAMPVERRARTTSPGVVATTSPEQVPVPGQVSVPSQSAPAAPDPAPEATAREVVPVSSDAPAAPEGGGALDSEGPAAATDDAQGQGPTPPPADAPTEGAAPVEVDVDADAGAGGRPEPIGGLESAMEAAWDVGRLPILLSPTPGAVDASEAPTGDWRERAATRPAARASADAAMRWRTQLPPPGPEPIRALVSGGRQEQPDRASVAAPAPDLAQVPPPVPAAEAPLEIELPDFPPRRDRSGEPGSGPAGRQRRSSEGARARIAAHRERLDRIVSELAQLAPAEPRDEAPLNILHRG